MEQINLEAVPREILGQKVKHLRKNGQIPAVLYGRDFKTVSLSLDKKEFEKVYDEAGTSSIVNLKIEGGDSAKVLLHEPQRDPVTDEILHVDFFKVNMKQEIRTEIPLVFIGAAPAVEDLDGTLTTNKDAVEVECLPDKLIPEIEVDLAALKTFEDSIKIADLNIPEGIKVLTDAEEIVAQVAPPRSEEEMEALEQESVAATEEKEQIANIEAAAEEERAEREEARESGEEQAKE